MSLAINAPGMGGGGPTEGALSGVGGIVESVFPPISLDLSLNSPHNCPAESSLQ